jgi:BirA family biotin operon repressor/biotin-[acetyl-CoA-carboxylase] ligase
MDNGMDRYFPGAFSGFLHETSSTMDEARRLSERYPYGCIRAGVQTAGRGRLPGRCWHAEAGHSLLATFWFPAGEFGDAPLPLLAGLALADALESWAGRAGVHFIHHIELKWPNDVLCGGKKLAGILCEAAGSSIYAGIGVNCAQEAFPPGFRTDPTSIALGTGLAPAPEDLIADLARAFHDLRESSASWKPRYESRLAWKGLRVVFLPGLDASPVEGTLFGVDDSGALVLMTEEGISVFASGELSKPIGTSPDISQRNRA